MPSRPDEGRTGWARLPSAHASLRVAGPAAPTVAWRRYDEPARWPGWAPQIRAVDYPHRLLHAGSTGVVRGPLAIRVRFRIESVDREQRRWTWQVSAFGMRLRLTHGLEADATGSVATLQITGPTVVVQAYAVVARLALRRLLTP